MCRLDVGGDRLVMKILPALSLMLAYFLLSGTGARAQSGPESGGHELQVWTGGGGGAYGGTLDTGRWEFGVRSGWVLNDGGRPAAFRGRFLYAVGGVPGVCFAPRNRTA